MNYPLPNRQRNIARAVYLLHPICDQRYATSTTVIACSIYECMSVSGLSEADLHMVAHTEPIHTYMVGTHIADSHLHDTTY